MYWDKKKRENFGGSYPLSTSSRICGQRYCNDRCGMNEINFVFVAYVCAQGNCMDLIYIYWNIKVEIMEQT